MLMSPSSLTTTTMNTETVTRLITDSLDNQAKVTYRSLSLQLSVPITEAKRLLDNYVQEKLSESSPFNIIYYVSGQKKSTEISEDSIHQFQVKLVDRKELPSVLEEFSSTVSHHVYSIEDPSKKIFKTPSCDAETLANIGYLRFPDLSTPKKPIKPSIVTKPSVPKPSVPTPTTVPVKQTVPEVEKDSNQPKEHTEITHSKPSISEVKPSKPSAKIKGLSSFFGAASKVKRETPEANSAKNSPITKNVGKESPEIDVTSNSPAKLPKMGDESDSDDQKVKVRRHTRVKSQKRYIDSDSEDESNELVTKPDKKVKVEDSVLEKALFSDDNAETVNSTPTIDSTQNDKPDSPIVEESTSGLEIKSVPTKNAKGKIKLTVKNKTSAKPDIKPTEVKVEPATTEVKRSKPDPPAPSIKDPKTKSSQANLSSFFTRQPKK